MLKYLQSALTLSDPTSSNNGIRIKSNYFPIYRSAHEVLSKFAVRLNECLWATKSSIGYSVGVAIAVSVVVM